MVAHAPVQLGHLGGDLLVAPREREQLEQDHEELRRLGHRLVQRLHERAEQRVGAVDAGDRVGHPLHPQVAVAAHDLDEQPLLRAEVVVQQPARDAGLARDVVERRARRAARPTQVRIASTIRCAFSPESSRLGLAASMPERLAAFVRLLHALADPRARGRRGRAARARARGSRPGSGACRRRGARGLGRPRDRRPRRRARRRARLRVGRRSPARHGDRGRPRDRARIARRRSGRRPRGRHGRAGRRSSTASSPPSASAARRRRRTATCPTAAPSRGWW